MGMLVTVPVQCQWTYMVYELADRQVVIFSCNTSGVTLCLISPEQVHRHDLLDTLPHTVCATVTRTLTLVLAAFGDDSGTHRTRSCEKTTCD